MSLRINRKFLYIFLICTFSISFSFGQTENLEEENAAAERNRHLGEKFGLLGALMGIICVAGAYYYQTKKITRLNKELALEKDKSEKLLLNILPEDIAKELKDTGKTVAKSHTNISVLFTDFKDFTKISELLSPAELVNELDECFKAFDDITIKHGIEKIKVIGDAYMAAGGLTEIKNAVADTVHAALEMQEYIKNRKLYRTKNNQPAFTMRAGIHTGTVTAGVTGSRKFQYDIWGDTVNTASRMESSGEEGKVNISDATYQLIKNDQRFNFIHRGNVEAKNKGEMEMYFVEIK